MNNKCKACSEESRRATRTCFYCGKKYKEDESSNKAPLELLTRGKGNSGTCQECNEVFENLFPAEEDGKMLRLCVNCLNFKVMKRQSKTN